MTKLLEEAIATVREIPEDMQDMAAEALMRYLNEIPTMDDLTAMADRSAH